ncbi:MAG: GatB/YqeY domain-containing protein [Pseudomonadota bacterium]|nr:GatB/YqeY domain-containing protein [Pseudomonadota bacterium]
MSIRNKILEDIKTAMKGRDQVTLDTLRFLNSAIKNKEMEAGATALTDNDVLAVLKKSVKQRNESIEQFQKAGRTDLVDSEKAGLAILEKYLPQAMGRDQIEKIVTEVITSLNANSIKQMGAVMKEVQAKCQGTADGKLVSEIVKAKLS